MEESINHKKNNKKKKWLFSFYQKIINVLQSIKDTY